MPRLLSVRCGDCEGHLPDGCRLRRSRRPPARSVGAGDPQVRGVGYREVCGARDLGVRAPEDISSNKERPGTSITEARRS